MTFSLPPGLGPDSTKTLGRVSARRQAWSASGICGKKDHILDCRAGRPVRDRLAVWVAGSLETLSGQWEPHAQAEIPTASEVCQIAPSPAAVAEALSTAFMVLGLPEIKAVCQAYDGLEAWVLAPASEGLAEAPPVLLHYARNG